MKRIRLELILLLFIPLSIYAQDIDKKDLLPSSELHIAYSRIGSIIKSETYLVESPAKQMITKAMIVTNLETKEVKKGLEIRSFQQTGLGTSPIFYTAYIDIDEVEHCLNLFAYFQQNYADRPADEVQTGIAYNTRCGSSIGVATDQKEWTIYIKLINGNENTSFYFKQKDLPKIVKMFAETSHTLAKK